MPRPTGLPKTGGRPPGGRNKITADVKEAAQVYTAEAIKALAKIMRDSESDAAKVAAVKEILDRGHGKSAQAVNLTGDVNVAIREVKRTLVRPNPGHTNG